MSHVVLIRGLPGSGKSTLARNYVDEMNKNSRCRELFVLPRYVHLETDNYFLLGGEYRYDHNKIKEAHEWCQWKAERALEAGLIPVVANTFSRLWEMEPYFRMTETRMVIKCTGKYGNVHGVPQSVVEVMKDRWEDFEGEIKV